MFEWKFLYDTAKSFLEIREVALDKWLPSLLKKRLLRTKMGYFMDLKKNLSKMPFIYKELYLEVSLTIQEDHVAPLYGYCPFNPHTAKHLQFYDNNVDDGLQDEHTRCPISC